MDIVLEPPTGAAGIDIGASRTEAERQLAAHGEPKTFRRGDEGNQSLALHTASGLSVFAYFDDADQVEAVELSGPDSGDTVTFEGIDVFDTPADEVIEQLTRRTPVQVEENGCSVTAPELLLALWRPTVPESDQDQEGRHFESVLVARPGYFD